MSGRRIDDHHFWAGARSKDSVFPKGVHTKHESSAEGSGHLDMYEDTTEKIRSQQEMAKHKVKGHKHKEGTRN